MLTRLVKFQATAAALHGERGAAAVEGSLRAALVAVVIVAAFAALGSYLSTLFATIVTAL